MRIWSGGVSGGLTKALLTNAKIMLNSGNEYDVAQELSREILALIQALEEPDSERTIELPAQGGELFLTAAVSALARLPVTAGSRRFVGLLSRDHRFVRMLTDPSCCRSADAEIAARSSGPTFEDELERELSILIDAGSQDDDRTLRLLGLFDAAGAERRCVWYQSDLMASRNVLVRSKAAKLFARGSRRPAVATRLLHDLDPRVQASAVESLWKLGEANALHLLLEAAQSTHPRVVGNAAVGLHNLDHREAIRVIRRMSAHADVRFRTSAVWVMGETGDARFLRYLNLLANERQGVPRLLILRAMSRIRLRQRDLLTSGAVELLVTEALAEPDGARRVRFSVVAQDRTPLRTLEVAVTEGEREVDDFVVTAVATPAVVVAGFVVPPVSSPLGQMIVSTLERCQRFQRKNDVWSTTHFRDGDRLTLAAVDRLATKLSSIPGSRQLILLVDGPQNEPNPKLVEHLRGRMLRDRIGLEVFLPRSEDCAALAQVLRSIPGCKVTEADAAELPERLERACAELANRYELRYRSLNLVNESAIAINGVCGCGATTVHFEAVSGEFG